MMSMQFSSGWKQRIPNHRQQQGQRQGQRPRHQQNPVRLGNIGRMQSAQIIHCTKCNQVTQLEIQYTYLLRI
jgi:hypothetical protein